MTGKNYTYEQAVVNKQVDDNIIFRALSKTLHYLSYGIVNLIMQLNPQEIILGFKPDLFDYNVKKILDEYISENWFHNLENVNTKVRYSNLTNNGFILGVASMVVEEVIKNPVFTGYKSLL